MSNNNHKDDAPFSRPDVHAGEIETHLEHISREFRDGFEFLRKYPKTVTIFGSSATRSDEPIYGKAEELSRRIVRELKYAILTGGGPGIMEAANKGAYEIGGISLGLNISLPHERTTNAYVTHAIKFSYFFSRKTMLMFAAEAYVFFPGGYGTFDELFSVMTLIQTDKVPRVPVILFDSKYWNPWKAFLADHMLRDYHAIDKKDLTIFEITDSLDRAIEIIKDAPVNEWWGNIS
jgi:uncharacterized protein (TIGR00730 family)